MNRRDFLLTAGAASAGVVFPKAGYPREEDVYSAPWRTFEVTTRIEVLKPSGTTRIWVPAALTQETPFQKTLSNTFQTEGVPAKLVVSKLKCPVFIAREVSGLV